MRGLALIAAVFLGVARAAAAEPLTLAFTEFYPVTRTENGRPAGPGIELARILTEGLAVRFGAEAVPLRRLMSLTEARPMIVIALVRTARREERFRWIGELYRDSLVMATRKPNPRIESLDQARGLGRIGVTLGGIAQAMLEERHFTNIEPSLDMTAQARKLANGRVDAWCALRQSARDAWNSTGLPAEEIEMGAEIETVSIWMAASLPVPPETVEELRRRFAQLQRDGTVERIFKGLR
jgi:polar amino acid transport system substrate-binding protein